jgi:hypothetical protein
MYRGWWRIGRLYSFLYYVDFRRPSKRPAGGCRRCSASCIALEIIIRPAKGVQTLLLRARCIFYFFSFYIPAKTYDCFLEQSTTA